MTALRCVAESVAGDVLDDDEDSGAGTNCRVRFDLAPGAKARPAHQAKTAPAVPPVWRDAV
ncbi:MAG: hypothetical protein VYB65_12035 [Myxococcota bacterium]|nr:hypothetical protein [Myxococcota bacterium]